MIVTLTLESDYNDTKVVAKVESEKIESAMKLHG